MAADGHRMGTRGDRVTRPFHPHSPATRQGLKARTPVTAQRIATTHSSGITAVTDTDRRHRFARALPGTRRTPHPKPSHRPSRRPPATTAALAGVIDAGAGTASPPAGDRIPALLNTSRSAAASTTTANAGMGPPASARPVRTALSRPTPKHRHPWRPAPRPPPADRYPARRTARKPGSKRSHQHGSNRDRGSPPTRHALPFPSQRHHCPAPANRHARSKDG